MPYAVANGLHQYYEEEGSGPPLLLLTGATGTLDSPYRGGWAALRPALAQRFRVVQVETRGHGRTDNPGGPDAFTLPTLAADAAGLIGQLDLAPAYVAGFSLGGLVALELAFAHPRVVRSAVGVGASYTADGGIDAVRHLLDPERIEREEPDRAADLARRHDEHHGPGHWRDLLGWIVALAAAPRSYAVEDLGRIAVPTLWITGEDEQFFELDQLLTMKQRIPAAEVMIVNHADHFALLTHPHLVGPAITDFLARADERPRQ